MDVNLKATTYFPDFNLTISNKHLSLVSSDEGFFFIFFRKETFITTLLMTEIKLPAAAGHRNCFFSLKFRFC